VPVAAVITATPTLHPRPADSVPIADTTSYGSARVRTVTGNVPISDAVAGLRAAGKSATDTLTITDTVTAGVAPRAADTLTLTDTADGVPAYVPRLDIDWTFTSAGPTWTFNPDL